MVCGLRYTHSLLTITYHHPANRASALIHTYNTFVNRIEELGLHTAVNAKPILDVSNVLLLTKNLS